MHHNNLTECLSCRAGAFFSFKSMGIKVSHDTNSCVFYDRCKTLKLTERFNFAFI